MNHKNIIRAWCVVLAEKPNAIWYEDGGFRYADVFDPAEGWVSYSCNTVAEWEVLSE